MRSPPVLIAVTIAAVLVFTSSTPVSATPPRHWFRGGPPVVTVTVYDELHDAAWTRTLHTSVDEWNAGVSNITLVFGPGPPAAPADCEKGHGLDTVVVCIHKTAHSNWGAETIWHSNDKHIVLALVWVDTGSQPQSGRAALMCHEFGHVLGLAHRPASTHKTCMTPSAMFPHPDAQDFRTVTVAHDHIHSDGNQAAAPNTSRRGAVWSCGKVCYCAYADSIGTCATATRSP